MELTHSQLKKLKIFIPKSDINKNIEKKVKKIINLNRLIIFNLNIFILAESLGGVESLVCHPATMTHASMPNVLRDQIGITDGLIRLSIGIEDIDDLKDDIYNALKAI